VVKGKIAHDEQISPFSTAFFTHLENFLSFKSNLKLLPANSLSLEGSTFCHFGKGLRVKGISFSGSVLVMIIRKLDY
jgi:hypothetical protein